MRRKILSFIQDKTIVCRKKYMGQEAINEEFEQSDLSATVGRVTEVDKRMIKSISDISRSADFTHSVLSCVVRRKYDNAIGEVGNYNNTQKEYPALESITQRSLEHCKDLIHAIKMKRSIPGVENLSMAKRQHIYDAVMAQFDELKVTLKRIEKMEYNVRMVDLRSTIIVVKTFSWCVLAIVSLALGLEFYDGLFATMGSVSESFLDRSINWFFNLLNL